MRWPTSFFLSIWILLLPTIAQALDMEGLDPATLATLTRDGPLLVTDMNAQDRLRQATAITWIAAPPQAVWTALVDFEHYPQWMPQVVETSIVEVGLAHYQVAITLEMEFFLSFKVNYTLRYQHLGEWRMRFTQVEGDFAANEGSWEVRPYGEGSLLYYTASVDYGSMKLLHSMLEKQPAIELGLGASTVAVVARAVKRRVEGQGAP